jgi:hypothetical protein
MTGATKPTPTFPPHPIDEAWPPELRLLLGPDAAGLLAAAAGTAGGALVSMRPRQVNHQPGRSTVVQYRTMIRWPWAAEPKSETYVAATGDRIPPEGAALFDDGSTKVAVWRWPRDPYLPGLAQALNPTRVAALLDDLGIDGGSVNLRTRAYRPGRRAVVEATGRRGRLFLKLLRPDRAEKLHDRHRQLSSTLPVPQSLGWTNDGIIVLTALPGETLRTSFRSSHSVPLRPGAIGALLDRLPSELAQEPARRDLLLSAQQHAKTIASTLPESVGRLETLMDMLQSGPAEDPGPLTAVHGDLYEAQLLVDRGRITGLLDVDTSGAGYRVEDLANFCAHLSVLAQMSDRSRRIKRLGADLLDYAESNHPRSVIRRRIAAGVIGLATGPFRVMEADWVRNTKRRLDLAAEWLGDGGRA